jgi:hypothetical protein
MLDLPPHALDLLPQYCGKIGVPGCLGALGFLGQYGERRLQPMGQVTGFGQRVPYARIAVNEQSIEVVDKRLHFGRIHTSDLPLAPFTDRGQASS